MSTTNPHRWWSPPGRAFEPRNTAGRIPAVGQLIAEHPDHQGLQLVATALDQARYDEPAVFAPGQTAEDATTEAGTR